MVADPKLNMDITQVGAMTSVFPIFYGFSKFASGVLGARTAAHTLLGCGLMATALVNICFGFGSSLTWFCCFWALNGLLQVIDNVGMNDTELQHLYWRSDTLPHGIAVLTIFWTSEQT